MCTGKSWSCAEMTTAHKMLSNFVLRLVKEILQSRFSGFIWVASFQLFSIVRNVIIFIRDHNFQESHEYILKRNKFVDEIWGLQASLPESMSLTLVKVIWGYLLVEVYSWICDFGLLEIKQRVSRSFGA